MPDQSDKPLMRCLGEFVGHIVQGAKTPVGPVCHEVSRHVEEEKRQSPMGTVTLRRTTIDEVVMDRPTGQGAPGASEQEEPAGRTPA